MANHISVSQRAKAQLVLNEPFFATILLNMAIQECETLPDGRPLWIAATDGTTLYLNPKKFETLTLDEAKGVLKHECMHVAGMHNFRCEGKERRRWNRACDFAINPIIIDEGGALPAGGCLDAQYKGMTAEQIYALLPPEPDDGTAGQGMDDDIIPAKDKSQAAQDKAKTLISQAKQTAIARGKLPKHIEAEIDSVMAPKVDWREELRLFLTESSPSDFSFSKPNRMFITQGMYLPGMAGHDSMASFGVLLDTSGSITMAELEQGLGEIVGAIEDVAPKRLVVAYCDAKVQHADVFDIPGAAEVSSTFKRHGAGGTSMPAGLKWFVRNHPTVQAVMVWTDGETAWGNQDDYPFSVLWAISNPAITAPWGVTLHVDVQTS